MAMSHVKREHISMIFTKQKFIVRLKSFRKLFEFFSFQHLSQYNILSYFLKITHIQHFGPLFHLILIMDMIIGLLIIIRIILLIQIILEKIRKSPKFLQLIMNMSLKIKRLTLMLVYLKMKHYIAMIQTGVTIDFG